MLLIFQLSPGDIPLQKSGYVSYANFGVKYAGGCGLDEAQNKGLGGSGGGPARNCVSASGWSANMTRS